MKRTLLFIAFVLASLAMSAQASLAVEDVQNSDCLRKTRGEESEPLPTIVLTKEGSILSVQLLNYESVCGTSDFKVTPTVNDGKDGNPLSVSISVVPCIYGDDLPDCYCPYNVSFMVRDLEDNSFYLKCWWYEGLVTLEEGKPLVLEDITLNATIDGVNYTLKKTLGTATLTEVVEQKSEMIIPAELNYEGQAYAVKIITQTSFRDCSSIRKLDIPETVSTIYDYSFYGCKLDILIIRGFLEPHYINSNLLYGLGTDMKLYVQPSEVERYKAIYKGPVYPLPVNDPYRPLVEEGKHWTYDNFMPLRPAEYDHYYYYDLKGDTVIAGKNCFKMYSENQYNDNRVRYEGALYEENKKVYCFFPGKEGATLLYDFDCEVGDSIHNLYEASQAVVKDIRTVDNGGNDIKIYTIRPIMDDPDWGDEDDSLDFSWIEGVGAAQDFFNMMPASGNYCSLNACELNGEMLYQTIEPDLTAKGYHKMGIEGKRWNYIHYYFDEGGEHYDPYSYVVKGDTIIRHSTYKKLWYQDEKTERFVCFLRETGRTVYKNTDLGNNSYDSPIMSVFFEFSRDDFGRVFTWKAKNAPGNTNWMVYGVDTIEVKGQPFRRYTCLQKYSEEGETLTTIEYDGEDVWHDIWVEGVGSASSGIEDQILLHEPPEMPISDYTYFVSCYENGECIFTADDFNVQTKPVIDIAYRPFIEEGKVWKVGGVESRNPVRRVEYYYFDGDTIIGGKTCKQMMCQQYVNPDYADYDNVMKYPQLSYVGAWYEEDKKVYFCNANNKQLTLWYDFSADANETIQIHNEPYVVGPKLTGGIKGFKGVYREVDNSAHSVSKSTWLEGVGNMEAPIYSVYYGKELHAMFLMSCTVGDEVIYLNDVFEDGATPEEARKHRFDFTHTVKTQPKAPASPQTSLRRASGTVREAEQPLYGEYNDLQLGIHLDPLDEAYLVRITDETGTVVYEKAVNAGTIVGLNIDISAYPKGLYTVTVENNRESFTGEIDTRTTGISLTPAFSQGEGAIYNLQGQRISSLQRGLNIINRRKIYVR